MVEDKKDDSLFDLFVFETTQNTEQLEKIILNIEKDGKFSSSDINEIFRLTHTIKGSSAMMSYSHMASLSHKLEDLFFYIRENPSDEYDCGIVSDLVLSFTDFINSEINNIKDNNTDTDTADTLGKSIEDYLNEIKTNNQIKKSANIHLADVNLFKVVLFFDDGCEMENIRAFSIIRDLSEYANVISYDPADINDGDSGIPEIRQNGFTIFFESDKIYGELLTRFNQTPFIKDVDLSLADISEINEQKQKSPQPANIVLSPEETPELSDKTQKPDVISVKSGDTHENTDKDKRSGVDASKASDGAKKAAENIRRQDLHQPAQSVISVNVSKLDKLMNLVGELVIEESMVVENPDLKDLELPSFRKEVQRLNKIINELQDMVMSMRLVPLATTFQKTNRIVRDMSKKLGKEVHLNFIGEETEVDKNIIEHLSDPLLHIVRNSIDHGIESREDRIAAGKPEIGTVSIEAYNEGSNVYIIVKDDGRGLDKEKILKKAKENNLLKKSEHDMTDREIYNIIFLPGFSTNETVTEYSGRGVGMDVVMQNIISIGGNVSVDSIPGAGTAVTMKMPLTVAIIDGMNISVGDTRFTIPISAIIESFKPDRKNIIRDVNGHEAIMVRGVCYAIVRLHKIWDIDTQVKELTDGILVMVEQDDKRCCIFADGLIGKQQVVVKTMPALIKETKLTGGISGCTLLGDGSISLILNTGWLVNTDIY